MPSEENILAHCRVKLEGVDHTYEGDSGDEGIISFDDIAEDVYTLTVEKDGYEPYTEENIIIDENNRTLRAKVALKELPHELTLVILTNPENIEGLKVVLLDKDAHIIHHGKTDKEGQIIFPKVKYGRYMLKVTGEGYQRYTSNIMVNSTNNNPRKIEVPIKKLEE